MLLADSAQAVAGKLYVLGGGWSMTGPDPSPMALAIKVEIPWDQTNHAHQLRIELLDADGNPVRAPGDGDQPPLIIEGNFEVGRPPGMKAGTPIDFPFAVNLGPIPLDPDSRYTWQLSIDGHRDEDWHVSFTTRPASAQQQPSGMSET
jgi:hypothetical protein